MARLFEYQGKKLLQDLKIKVPEGKVATSPEEAKGIAEELGCPVVIKAQAWSTKRADAGGIKFAETPDEAFKAASEILGMTIKNLPITEILIEKKLEFDSEFYAGVIIDDTAKAPVVIFSSKGGTGIEEIARDHPDKVARTKVDINRGLLDFEARRLVKETGLSGKMLLKGADILTKLFKAAKKYEARSAEINPIALTADGNLVALDCRVAVDDYAVFRHPELGIDIAREMDRPPTELEKIAFSVEAGDYRGTFYFLQLEEKFGKDEGYLAFHGAGGGGSMMSMDAVLKRGFKLANFCDTSGNPPASKVYRAAKIILSQPGLDGYFGSGSGVASQEQFHSARGLLKAFLEEWIRIPAVVRLGGNMEEKAIEILTKYSTDLPVVVECYGKNDTPSFCAERMETLIKGEGFKKEAGPKPSPELFNADYGFDSVTGRVEFDYSKCGNCESKVCVKECVPQILKVEKGMPVLAITTEEAKKGRCTECLACEVECRVHGERGCRIELPVPGLDEYRVKIGIKS